MFHEEGHSLASYKGKLGGGDWWDNSCGLFSFYVVADLGNGTSEAGQLLNYRPTAIDL